MHMQKRDLTITASDGFQLAATHYAPMTANGRAVLINAAMGVKRSYYAKYAEFLAGSGFVVCTYDYRGIGDSRPAGLRGFSAYLWEWGAKDQAALIGWIQAQYPDHKLLAVGHSVGGQLIGLTAQNQHIAGVYGVAAQSGYWGLWPGWQQLRMLLLWYGLIPLLTPPFGYFPASKIGLGEDTPSGVALDWAYAGRRRGYLLDFYGHTEHNHYSQFSGSMLLNSFSDDSYAPQTAVAGLLALYPNARRAHRHIRPRDVGGQPIGHFGFFRPAFEATLWTQNAAWLLEV
jgi:predicted alpha/beta hydrolase